MIMMMKMMMVRRLMVTRASNRAAVHGAKLPVTDTIDKEQVEKDINEGREMKENKTKEVEKTVDSQSNKSYADRKLIPPTPVNKT